ncbi:hypothetical protein [Mesorhizobium sp. B1-1-8]|uniref:hypothetical protein n=1 Tax=Mesorhizobium sp. B1-1-8 TaxID=2589976 RepID=UPI0011278939|nr:hypothetical protein [Mesorhizobium sp. B1-1-8]UCI07153.1 hypothetical protein FJ974_25715 [Mesorhizobium sp. B1-1-8]
MTAVTIKPISEIADSALDITEGESQLGYVKRVTDVVHLSTFNCDPTEFSLSWLDRLFLWRSGNPSAFAEGMLVKDRFTCGFCHQRAFLVHQALKRNGIASDVFGLNGHVVTRVNIDGKQYYTDSDYGVGPFPAAAETLEETVRNTYSLSAWGDPDLLASLYTSAEDNQIYINNNIDQMATQQATILRQSGVAANLLLSTSALYLLSCIFLTRRKAEHESSVPHGAATSADGPDAVPIVLVGADDAGLG